MAQRVDLAGLRVGHSRFFRRALQEVELEMEFGRAPLIVAPERPDHARQSADQRTVHRRWTQRQRRQRRRLGIGHARAQFFDDRLEQLRVERPGRFGKTPQAEARQFQFAADCRDVARLLQTAQTIDDGREEIQKQPSAELVVVQPALRVGAVVVERPKQIDDAGNILRSLNITRLQPFLTLSPRTFAGVRSHGRRLHMERRRV
jgi:hypothetical protein